MRISRRILSAVPLLVAFGGCVTDRGVRIRDDDAATTDADAFDARPAKGGSSGGKRVSPDGSPNGDAGATTGKGSGGASSGSPDGSSSGGPDGSLPDGSSTTGSGGSTDAGSDGSSVVGSGGSGGRGSGGASTGGRPSGGAGGAAGSVSGGASGGGGGPNTGGAGGSSSIHIVGSAVLCAGATLAPPTTPLAVCTANQCTGAHCVPAAQLPSGTNISLLAKCPDNSYCTPDDYLATKGEFLLKTCSSLDGAQGRCVSTCVPQILKQLGLPKDICADTERCAPCWNPVDGTDTGVCRLGCDTGPPANKVLYASCGSGRGLCVPSAAAPADLKDGAPQDTCTSAHLCIPTEKAKDPLYTFPKCTPTSIGGVLGLPNQAGQKGGCVPAYLTGSNAQLFAVDGCATGDLCAPCTNPLSMPANVPTGACPWP